MSAKCSLRSRPAIVRRWDRRRGFTLVEVLVVVGIIVVIASILVPMVSRARGQAARAKCANTLRGLGQAISAFSGEHNATLPTAGLDVPPANAKIPTTDWIMWGGTSAPNGIDTSNGRNTDYMNESGLAKYLGFATPDQSGMPNENLRKLYRCASVTDDERTNAPYKYDYAFNAQLSGMPMDRIDKAAQKVLLVEVGQDPVPKDPADTWTLGMSHRDDSAYFYWGSSTPGPAGTYPTGSSQDDIALRHGTKNANCLFADGHVDTLDQTHEWDYQYFDAYTDPTKPVPAIQPKNGTYNPAQ